jgi:hypothetical protein
MANGKTQKPIAWPSQKTIGHLMVRGRGSIRLNSKALVDLNMIKIILSKHNPITGVEKAKWINHYEFLPLSKL